MWTYSQKTGVLARDDTQYHGYAGRGKGKNNPSLQNLKGIGPLPRGKYTIHAPYKHPTVGRYAMPLIPHADNEMFGRASFFIHGDSREHPGLASHGCIIMPYDARVEVWASGDHELEVNA